MSFAAAYARAFLDLAPSDYPVEGFLDRAAVLERAISADARLKSFFRAPGIPQEAKGGMLEELSRRAGIDEFGLRLLRLALANRRIDQIGEILSAVAKESDRRRGVVAGRVVVAAPIGDVETQRLVSALSRKVGKTVRAQVEVDPRILAGFVARVGSEVFDASVVRAIERFREEIEKQAEA